MVVARFEGDEALLEARVLIDRLAAHRRRVIGIACATGESDLKVRLASVIEARLDRQTEVTVIARD